VHSPKPILDDPLLLRPAGLACAPCVVCGGVVHGRPPICFCCGLAARQLGLPLVPVVVMTDYRVGDADHRRLRGYKDGRTAEVRARYRHELVSRLAAWIAVHSRALVERTEPWSVVTTVPSTRRPGPAPAEALVDGVPELADRHLRLLGRGKGALDHLQATRDGFAPLPGVDREGLDGLPILVFDDSVTTGARAQSAAAALRLAGGRVVGILAVGRALAPDAALGG
jgi:predicted amidophosphoribosyltransferase